MIGKYMVRVWSGEYGESLYCALEITSALAEQIRKLREVIPALKEIHNGFLRIECLDYTPHFYERLPEELEPYEEAMYDYNKVDLPADMELPENQVRIDYCTMCVSDDTVHWELNIKHDETTYETEAI